VTHEDFFRRGDQLVVDLVEQSRQAVTTAHRHHDIDIFARQHRVQGLQACRISACKPLVGAAHSRGTDDAPAA
jgi:hypothetical protein